MSLHVGVHTCTRVSRGPETTTGQQQQELRHSPQSAPGRGPAGLAKRRAIPAYTGSLHHDTQSLKIVQSTEIFNLNKVHVCADKVRKSRREAALEPQKDSC